VANTKQATKRARQSEVHRQHNVSLRSALRTSVKKVIAAIKAGNKEEATGFMPKATSMLDRFARRGIIHSNKAARLKSRLNKHIKSMQ